MRPVALACLIVVTVAGCDDKPLTGPEARRAIVQAQHSNGTLPSGTVVVVDGVRLASDSVRLGSDGFLSDLDPSTVETVTEMKGAAAARLYGPNAKRVWLITTNRASVHR